MTPYLNPSTRPGTTRRKRVLARAMGVLCILAMLGIALTTLVDAAFPGIGSALPGIGG